MAKGVRTQPTSQNSTPTSQNLDFVYFILYFLGFSSVLNLKPCFATSTWTIFNGTRLDRCGLKSECERFEYGTNLMTRKFKKVKLSIFWPTKHRFLGCGFLTGLGIQTSRHPGIQASRHLNWYPSQLKCNISIKIDNFACMRREWPSPNIVKTDVWERTRSANGATDKP